MTWKDSTVIYASKTGAKLDSNVYTGGGTDDTDVLQAVLDQALTRGRVHLIMDGAALVRGLKVHSNTTIECPDRDCGFFLAPQSNCPIVRNADFDFRQIRNRNIALLGGTYNQDCLHQAHHVIVPDAGDTFGTEKWVFGLEFNGVENLTLRDLVIRNQSTFAFMTANWKHICIENVWIDLADRIPDHNQDGFHFWGPGQFLTMRDVGGCVGDDFMNLGPDEGDRVSSITDVLIDGVMLDHADQAIRMLSRGTGRLDRVTVRNVTGTYTSFGFYVNPWFRPENGEFGNFGSITFENIDLRPLPPTYTYTTPFLFRIGGNIESLVFRNIQHHHPADDRPLFQIGYPFSGEKRYTTPEQPVIESLLFDGVHIVEKDDSAGEAVYMTIQTPVSNLMMRNVEVIRPRGCPPRGALIRTLEGCDIDSLILSGVYASGMHTLVDADAGHVDTLSMHNVVLKNSLHGAVRNDKGVIDCTQQE